MNAMFKAENRKDIKQAKAHAKDLIQALEKNYCNTSDYLQKAYNLLPEEDRCYAEDMRDYGDKVQEAWDNRVED